MELFEAFAERHSYRGEFKNMPVPREDLAKIVEAGILAPSGCNAQTTSFAIVDDPLLLAEIRKLISMAAVQTAPAMIAVISQGQSTYRGMSFEVQDYAAAVENMLLAISGLGYASVWLDGVLRTGGIAAKIASLLNVPQGKNMAVTVILPVGVPGEKGRQNERLPFEQRAWFNKKA